MWKAIVDNAQACQGSDKVFCYIEPNQKIGVVFNILGRVLGLCSGSHWSQINTLSEKHKVDAAEELLASAYCNWKMVKVFDDLTSLHQHLYDNTENSMKGATMAHHLKRKPDPPYSLKGAAMAHHLKRKPDPPYSSKGATAPSFPHLDPSLTALGAQSFQTMAATTPSFPHLDPPPTALMAESFQTAATAPSFSFPHLDPPPTALVAETFQTASSFPHLDPSLAALGAQSFQTMAATTSSFPLLDPQLTALVAQSFQPTATASSYPLLEQPMSALVAQSFQTMATAPESIGGRTIPNNSDLPSPATGLVPESFQTTNSFWRNFCSADPSCLLLYPSQPQFVAESFQTTNSLWKYFNKFTDDGTTIFDAIIRELMDD